METQKTKNEIIQALKQGEFTLKEIVSIVCPEKPKLTKEERKQLKLQKQREWYARNKDWHKIYNMKKALAKAEVPCEHTAETKEEMKKKKQAEAYSRWYQKNKEYHKIYRAKMALKKELSDKEDEQPGNERNDEPGSEE
jgi:hypothetical protein